MRRLLYLALLGAAVLASPLYYNRDSSNPSKEDMKHTISEISRVINHPDSLVDNLSGIVGLVDDQIQLMDFKAMPFKIDGKYKVRIGNENRYLDLSGIISKATKEYGMSVNQVENVIASMSVAGYGSENLYRHTLRGYLKTTPRPGCN